VAEFRRGAEAMAAAAERKKGAGKFTPGIRWAKSGDLKYIQFITSLEQIPTMLMHQYIIVGHREDGKEQYEKFISRRDPQLDGPDGYDELWDRFGQNPTERSVALALVMEPVTETVAGKKKIVGFEPSERQYTNKDEETVSVPDFGLIIESPQTFWVNLTSVAEMIGKNIEDTVFAVKRNGSDAGTTYAFVDTNQDAIDVSEELDAFEFDFEAYLDDLSDEDRMRSFISDLPDDWRISNYDKRKKGKAEEKEKKQPRRQARAPKVEEAEEEAEIQVEESAEKAGPARSRRFGDLRAATTKK